MTMKGLIYALGWGGGGGGGWGGGGGGTRGSRIVF